MSRLYHTEEGRVIPSLCEELTRFRWARKTLDLPATSAPADVFVLARAYPGHTGPLRLAVNGGEALAVQPAGPGVYQWYRVQVEAGALREGSNHFDLWTETTAMDGWSLALEAGHASPGSELSDDGGVTWRRERMGYLNAVLAEYVLRVRVEEGEDPPPPAMVWEDPGSPRVQSLRERLPAGAREGGDTLARARVLSSWLAAGWEHTSSARGHLYGPWDAETALSWGPARRGHNGRRPILMCVHYAASLVSACQAVGIPARCAALTEAVNGSNGHFVAEVWAPEWERWVVVDPNLDALFVEDGVPMSMAEIQSAGTAIGARMEFGAGTAFQRTFPHMIEFLEQNLERGLCFRHRSLWHRADLLSRPRFSPPGHGSLSYCETGLVWERRDLERGFGMFPSFGDSGWFDAPPAGFPDRG